MDDGSRAAGTPASCSAERDVSRDRARFLIKPREVEGPKCTEDVPDFADLPATAYRAAPAG
jgi:hypothetical protein